METMAPASLASGTLAGSATAWKGDTAHGYAHARAIARAHLTCSSRWEHARKDEMRFTVNRGGDRGGNNQRIRHSQESE